ncbi:MAG: hypothetical protein AAGE52_31905, partial [Myxococcota bacterium]
MRNSGAVFLVLLLGVGCDSEERPDTGTDANVPDAGPDATADASADGGADAGVDAGEDGGVDAMVDAGFDARPSESPFATMPRSETRCDPRFPDFAGVEIPDEGGVFTGDTA